MNEPDRTELLKKLRHDMAHIEVEPMHVEEAAAPDPPPYHAPPQIHTGGYPIDYQWSEAADYAHRMSEGSQE